MLNLVFLIGVWSILIRYNYIKKKRIISTSTVLLSLYLLSFLLSYPSMLLNESYDNTILVLNFEYFDETVIFVLLLLLFIYPFCSFDETRAERIYLPNINILKIFSYVILILSLFSVIYFVPIVLKIFALQNLGEARNSVVDENIFITPSIWNTIASTSASLYSIAIVLSLIFFSLGINRLLAVLLLIFSTSYIVNVFAYVGRDGIVFWLFSFIGIYTFFSPYLTTKDKRIFKRLLFITLSAMIPLFILISMGRFENNFISSLFSYIGQSYPNFCLALSAPNYPVNGGAGFPLFRSILGLSELSSQTMEFGLTQTWVFGTFVKSFILNVDIVGTIIIGIFFFVIFKAIFRNRDYFYFYKFFIYIMFFQIYSQGVFYFTFANRGGNMYIIISFVLFIVFFAIQRFKSDTKNTILYKKT